MHYFISGTILSLLCAVFPMITIILGGGGSEFIILVQYVLISGCFIAYLFFVSKLKFLVVLNPFLIPMASLALHIFFIGVINDELEPMWLFWVAFIIFFEYYILVPLVLVFCYHLIAAIFQYQKLSAVIKNNLKESRG